MPTLCLSLISLILVFASGLLRAEVENEPMDSAEPIEISTEEPVPTEADSETPSMESSTIEPTLPVEEKVFPETPVTVYRVPVRDQIGKPIEFILRRSIKEAIENDIDVLLLDMDTPGGRLDVTFEMMEMLDRFEGDTITYVNKDAVSAGAYISMSTDRIFFSPDGVMGAAAVVSGAGQEIDESMKAKINSYLLARMRSYTDEYPYRAELIRAMADLEYELKIDEVVLKEKGELLSLTSKEATQLFGDPPTALLADGIAADVDQLLSSVYGPNNYSIESFNITWSEELAQYMAKITPILLGLGLLALFIEFKTPGFGIFGISGLILVGIVFASNYVVGLAGYEAFIVFFIGLIFIVVDIFLLPGTIVFLIIGILMILGSLLWSLSDIWPQQPDSVPNNPIDFGFTVDPNSVWSALYQTMGGLAIAVVGLLLIWRFLPSTPLYRHLVLQTPSPEPDLVSSGGGSASAGQTQLPSVGSQGKVVQILHPVGKVEIDGQYYEATVRVGSLSKGEDIVVVGYGNFVLIVEKRGKKE